jgi:hypothetical protein
MCRSYLYNRQSCCTTFEPTAEMLSLFNIQMYIINSSTEESLPSTSRAGKDDTDESEISNYILSFHSAI